MNHHDSVVIVDIQHQIFNGLDVVGTPSSAGRQYTISIFALRVRTAPNLVNMRETLD